MSEEIHIVLWPLPIMIGAPLRATIIRSLPDIITAIAQDPSRSLTTDSRASRGVKSFGWIFSSSQYLNSPKNSVYDIKLEKCLEDDPIFLRNNSLI